MTNPKMEACPFDTDGSHNVFVRDGSQTLSRKPRIECSCGVRGPDKFTTEDAIEAWNRRPATPPVAPAWPQIPVDEIKDLHPDRWEKGIAHHPKSVAIMDAIAHIDYTMYRDHFCWKMGGDGDNGECLMYEMDIYFESLDRAVTPSLPPVLTGELECPGDMDDVKREIVKAAHGLFPHIVPGKELEKVNWFYGTLLRSVLAEVRRLSAAQRGGGEVVSISAERLAVLEEARRQLDQWRGLHGTTNFQNAARDYRALLAAPPVPVPDGVRELLQEFVDRDFDDGYNCHYCLNKTYGLGAEMTCTHRDDCLWKRAEHALSLLAPRCVVKRKRKAKITKEN